MLSVKTRFMRAKLLNGSHKTKTKSWKSLKLSWELQGTLSKDILILKKYILTNAALSLHHTYLTCCNKSGSVGVLCGLWLWALSGALELRWNCVNKLPSWGILVCICQQTEKINIFRDNTYSRNSAAKGNLSIASDIWLRATQYFKLH